MASEDVKMGNAAPGSAIEETCSELAEVGLQSKTDEQRKAVDNASSDDEGVANVPGECDVDGVTTVSAKTPVSANGGAAATDTAGTPGGTSGRKVHADRPTREDPAAVERLRAYVTSLGGTLPEGWMGVYRMRMSGTSAGQYDLHYRSPEGRLVRSRAEVLRILGLDPSGGAGGGCAAKKASTGKGSKKATGAQPADEGTTGTAGAAPAANPASPGGRGGSGTAVSRWTLPLELPRKEALKSAKERAAELGLKPPFITDRGVTILSLGSFHKAPGFYDATHIWPLGYRAAWIPQHDPAAASPGAKKKSKKKKTSIDKDAAESGSPGKAAADGDEQRPESGADALAAAAAPPPPAQYRFVSEILSPKPQTVTGDGPCFAVFLERNPDAPSTANGNGSSPTEPMLVHVAISPDVAWHAIPDLQAAATALCKRAKPNGAGMQPTAMQRALASMPPVSKVWGMDCFGLSDIRVLQLLEVLPGVESCEDYLFVQQRNSWELEATAISTKRNVVLSAAANRGAAAAASKQLKRQQQLFIEAFVDRSAPSPKPDGTLEQEAKCGLEATSGAAGIGIGKKSTVKLKTDGKTPAGGSGKGDKAGKMTREDLEIRGVLDRMVERVSLVMAEPDEKERQKMLKAMEKSNRAAARRREKTAEKAAEKAAAAGNISTEAPENDKEKDKCKLKEKDKEKKSKEKSTGKSRATKEKEKDTGGAASKGASGATQAVPDGFAAAPPLPQLHGNQVDERALETAELPAPSGMLLELSYAMGGGSGVEADADAEICGSAAASALSTAEVQHLLSVYQFLWDHRKLLGLEGRVPSLVDLLAVVSEPPARLSPPARRAADEIHLSLVRLLLGEALDELLAHIAETTSLHRRDLSSATPPITAATWPELARRYLAAAAAARYLATSEPRSSALASLQLPGQLQNLEPADWLHYLVAGLNFPHLLSRIALLPHASSRWAADALLAADDARARAAAERALQGIKSFDLQHLDGEGQVRRGRRLLHAILTLPEGGEQLGFYAPEFGEVLRAPRGLDLHMVAARLDAGLYQSTGDWLQALATDVRSALALWHAALSSPKGKDIPGHQDARADLADEAEHLLNELLSDPDSKLALPAPADAMAVLKTDDDTEMQDAGGSGSGKGPGKGAKPQKSRSARRRKQQTDEGGQDAAEEDDGDKDPASLDDPTRLFNPRDGCRVCWLDEDKNRILLCDGCDGEYHCYCVEPPLLEVPEGSWFCPSCTARGLGLPKAEEESEDPVDVDAASDRRLTPRASTPSRTAAAIAAGGASISPSDGSAPGTAPCSPAFQHCHSHSHLVSDLHDRAAARRHQSRIGQTAVDAPTQGLPAVGCDVAGTEIGEAPLSIPGDVPEGPRVTLRANSRPGLQELQGLLRLAHLLGNYDYATGGPVGSLAGTDSAGNGWTPARRLALLSTLCALAMDTNALRSSLDEIVETRKKARVEVNSIKSKARQIQEEQALAKKAAAEKENAPKAEGDSDANANAGAGTTGVAAGKSAKGGKAGGAKGSTKDAKGKGDKTGKKGVDATAKESKDAADDDAGVQETKDGKESGDTTATKSRSKGRTDVSVLPEDELKRLMSLELQVEGLAVRQEALGEDRHGSRYWWLGADHLNPQGPQGVVLVEQLPPGYAVVEQAKASQLFSERQIARQKEEEAQKASEEEKKKKAESAAVRDAGDADAGEQELDEWGLPKERPRPRTVAIGFDVIPGRSWALYHTLEQLNTLLGWLNPKGIREGPLRTALLRARDRIAASQAPAAASAKQKQPPPTARPAGSQGEQRDQSQGQANEAAGSVEGAADLPLPPPQLLCPAVTLATAGGRRGGGGPAAARQGSLVPAEVNTVEGGAPMDSPEAVALRTELLALHRGLPTEAFSQFWGSTARQKQWFSFVEGTTTPQHLCAALAVLEAMLVDEAFRPHWRLYCMPAQHPELCTTWAAAWYRLGGLQGAIRKQILPQRELRHQAVAEASVLASAGKTDKMGAGKKKKAAPGKKEQQVLVVSQERTARRGGSVAPPLPDISNVRSREAAALLGIHVANGKAQRDAGGGKAHKGAGGGGARGEKRQHSVSENDDDEDSDHEDEDEDAENKSSDRNRRKRAATTAARDRSRRPAAGSTSKGKVKEQPGEEMVKEEDVSGSYKEASASGSDYDEEDDDEDSDEPSSDEGIAGRKRKAQPSRVATRNRRVMEKEVVKTRMSGRLRKAEPEDNDNSSDSNSEEEERVMPKTRRSSRLNKACTGEGDSNSTDSEEEDARLTKRSRGPAAAAAAVPGRPNTRLQVAGKSDVEDSDSEKGRTRGRGSIPDKQTKGTKTGIGSRAAAILANRKRALENWMEEESEDTSNEPSGSGRTSSSEDEQLPAINVAVAKRGKQTTSRATVAATGKRGMGKQQQKVDLKKPPPRRMARSEVEYDVEDFDDLNT